MKSYVSLTVLTLGLNYVYRKSRQQDGGLRLMVYIPTHRLA